VPEVDIIICPHEIEIVTPCAELCTVTARDAKYPDMKLDEPYRNSRLQTVRRGVTLLSHELQVHTVLVWSIPGRWLTRGCAKTTVNYLLMLKLCCDGYWDSC
jgi:hypothetical protein